MNRRELNKAKKREIGRKESAERAMKTENAEEQGKRRKNPRQGGSTREIVNKKKAKQGNTEYRQQKV